MTVEGGIRNQACGSLLGLAVGDAFGTTLESRASNSYVPMTDLIGGKPFELVHGF